VDKKMLQEKSEFVIHYAGGNIRVRIEASAEEMAHREMTLQKMTFIETDGMISMEAEHFAENIGTKAGAFCILPEYGKTRSGVKAYPCNRSFKKTEAPHLEYRIRVEREGDYEISLYTAPANPFTQWERMEFGLAVNGEEMREIPLIPEDYRSGEPSCAAWCEMVLNQIRIVKQSAHLQQGDNSLRIYALKPGFILEKIVLVRSDKKLPDSYLGPEESYYVN
jgi:hypothetical protein